MNRIILILIIFSQVVYSQTGWTKIESSTTEDLSMIYFSSDSVGWACGNDGLILTTKDAGQNWGVSYKEPSIPYTTSTSFTALCFVTKDTGIVIGNWGTILKTNNAGFSWEIIQKGIQSDDMFNAIQFIDKENGFILGADNNKGNIGFVLKTTDGGNTWAKKEILGNNFLSCNFISKEIGWAGSYYGFQKTTDGGETWFEDTQISTSDGLVLSIDFISSNIGYLITTDGATQGFIFKTEDSGITWNKLPNKFDIGIRNLYFVSEQIGWVVGVNGAIYKTVDGGISWNKQISGTQNWLLSVFFNNEKNGFIVGDSGTILRTNNGGTTSIANNEFPLIYFLHQNYPNPFNPSTYISFELPTSCYVSLQVYDVLGREVVTLINSEMNPGNHKVNFYGTSLSSGIYFYTLKTKDYWQTKKMILMR